MGTNTKPETPTIQQFNEGTLEHEEVANYLKKNLKIFGFKQDNQDKAIQVATDLILQASEDWAHDRAPRNPVIRAVVGNDLRDAINNAHSGTVWSAVPLVHGFFYNKAPTNYWQQ